MEDERFLLTKDNEYLDRVEIDLRHVLTVIDKIRKSRAHSERTKLGIKLARERRSAGEPKR